MWNRCIPQPRRQQRKEAARNEVNQMPGAGMKSKSRDWAALPLIQAMKSILDNTFDRTDTSILNVLRMLRPIIEELELVGKIMPATELAQICRRRKSRLPLRSYNGLRMAEQLDFAAKRGGIIVGDLAFCAYMEFDPVSRRRSPRIGIERAWLGAERKPKEGVLSAESEGGAQ